MGGGGSIAGMITSLKNNNRRKVHSPFSKDKIYKIKKESLDDYDFPDATPEQLEKIKNKLRVYNKTVRIKSIVLTIVILMAFIYLIVFI